MEHFSNFELDDIVTPIDVEKLQNLLEQSHYDPEKTAKLVTGFKSGFDTGYRGPKNRRDTAKNIPIRGVGSPFDMWTKIMKEVKLGRYAGPFDSVPYTWYIQSPLGLVPKAGNKTHLIFNLSFDFGPEEHQKSVNYHTPDDICSVKYSDLDHVVRISLMHLDRNPENRVIYYAKTDIMSAFRVVSVSPHLHWTLVMAAPHPDTKVKYFFVEKCLSLGASISCAVFQDFSNALKHITEYFLGQNYLCTNYLDDFLYLAGSKQVCNYRLNNFLEICHSIGCPVSEEKTRICI